MVIPIHEACSVSVCLGFVFVDRIVTLQKIRAALFLVVCKCIYVYIYMHIHIYMYFGINEVGYALRFCLFYLLNSYM